MADDGQPPINWGRVSRFALFVGVLLLCVIVAGALYASLLLPIALSAFFTYLLLPLVDGLERRKVPRSVAVIAIILSSVALVVFGVVRLAPQIYQQGMALARLIPVAINAVIDNWLPAVEKAVADLGLMSAEEMKQYVQDFNLFARLESQIQSGIYGLWRTSASLAGGVVNIVMIPFLTFFLLNDYQRFKAGALGLIPRDLVEPARFIALRINQTLRSVLKGQVTVAGILGVLYVIGLSAVGLQSAVVIGVVAGLCRVVPYLDVIVGGTLSMIVIVSDFQGWTQVLSVALVFLIVQLIDGALITPRVIGERVGLHPMVVVLSVIAFADWLGFWGVLLAIPIIAIAKVLLEAALPYYRQSKAYLSVKD